MIDNETQASTASSARRWGTGAALVAAGLAGGMIIAGTVSATAATSTPSPSTSQGTSGGTAKPAPLNPGDPSKPQRSDETLLTGDTAEKVRAAALAKYPGATVERVETDSDGVYEAHIVTTDGTHLEVKVDKSFTVTGAEQMTGGRGHGGGPGNGETALTGDTADKVKAAALAKYPGATVERVETDSDGVYEAHIVTTDGTHLEVKVDKSFTVTGADEMNGGRGQGGPGSGAVTPTPTTTS